jgi:hypothetical protein
MRERAHSGPSASDDDLSRRLDNGYRDAVVADDDGGHAGLVYDVIPQDDANPPEGISCASPAHHGARYQEREIQSAQSSNRGQKLRIEFLTSAKARSVITKPLRGFPRPRWPYSPRHPRTFGCTETLHVKRQRLNSLRPRTINQSSDAIGNFYMLVASGVASGGAADGIIIVKRHHPDHARSTAFPLDAFPLARGAD